MRGLEAIARVAEKRQGDSCFRKEWEGFCLSFPEPILTVCILVVSKAEGNEALPPKHLQAPVEALSRRIELGVPLHRCTGRVMNGADMPGKRCGLCVPQGCARGVECGVRACTHPLSPIPNTANEHVLRESGGRDFRSKKLQKGFILSGGSPCPVVEQTNI